MKLGELQEMLARAISEPDSVGPELLQAGISARAPLDAAARAVAHDEKTRGIRPKRNNRSHRERGL